MFQFSNVYLQFDTKIFYLKITFYYYNTAFYFLRDNKFHIFRHWYYRMERLAKERNSTHPTLGTDFSKQRYHGKLYVTHLS